MSMIGAIEILLDAGWADTSTERAPIGAVASGLSLHAELTSATSVMAANVPAREVPADIRRIENLQDGWQVGSSFRAISMKPLPITARAENRQKMPAAHAR